MFDAIIIGAGSGGLAAAKAAKNHQANVAIVEKGPIGGTCVNVGCVPKKLMLSAAHLAQHITESEGFGWRINAQFKWESLVKNQLKVVASLAQNHEKKLKDLDIPILNGSAKFIDANTLEVSGKQYQAKQFLIATGAKAKPLDCKGAELCDISDHFFEYTHLPQEIIIIGGGYIACEFASMLSLLGSKVHLIVRSKILRSFDKDVQSFIASQLKKRIVFHENSSPYCIKKQSDSYEVTLSNGKIIKASHVLNATGRIPNLSALDLEKIQLDPQNLSVNSNFQTSQNHISAIGDLVSPEQLTPLAIAQGRWWAAHHFSKEKPIPFQSKWIPTAVFTIPEYACVGYSEDSARKLFEEPIKIYQQSFTPLSHLMLSEEKRQKVLMKMICLGEQEKIIGLHLIGPAAAEIIQSLAISLECNVTKKDFDNTMALHPCLAEEWVTWY